MPKLLLIEPPFYRLYKNTYSLHQYPLALGYLAGTVRSRTNWQVMAYNADFSPAGESPDLIHMMAQGYSNYREQLQTQTGPVWNEIRETMEAYQPDVVGISTKSANFTASRLVAKIAKTLASHPVVVVGGPHVSMVKSEVLSHPEIDIAVMGEGEETLLQLLEALERKSAPADVAGIIYRDGDKVRQTPQRPLISDLDLLCFPHTSAPEVLKDYQHYPASAFGKIFSTRGCPYNCFFCGSREVWTRAVRHRSVANVMAEIDSLMARGTREIYFADDTFGVSKQRIFALCGAIAERFRGLWWSCELHVNLIDPAVLRAMKKANCQLIQMGIESGSNHILREMRKGYTIEKALAAARMVKEAGIYLSTFFMVGLPQETEETLRATIKAIEQADSDEICYSIFTPYPGTEAFAFCRERGLVDDSYDASIYNHKSPENCFCAAIKKERFRQLCSELEESIAARNRRRRLKRALSFRTLKKIQELGFKESFNHAMNLMAQRSSSTR
ncbi:MAG: radical SAM protein [Candidatus Korobacteraceae bacterium]|jgi:tRNA A37 methylthiotransferase MiaB